MASKIPYKEIKNMFEKEGFKLITEGRNYRNTTTKVDIKCPRGHLHSMLPKDFKNGTRCAKCAGLAKYTIEDVKHFANKLSYTLVSDKYEDSQKPLEFICSVGHKYITSFTGIKARGNRCRKCKGSRGEVLVGYILQQMLPKHEAYKAHQTISYKGRKYEFDFVIGEGRSLYIEYDGEQHYRPIEFYGGKQGYDKQVKRDNMKEEYVAKKGGDLLRISYTRTDEEIREDIKLFLKRNKIKIKNKEDIDLKYFKYYNIYGTSMNEVAEFYLRHSMKETVNEFKIHETTVHRYFKNIYGKSKETYIRETFMTEVATYYLLNDLDKTVDKYDIPKYAIKNYFIAVYGKSKTKYKRVT